MKNLFLISSDASLILRLIRQEFERDELNYSDLKGSVEETEMLLLKEAINGDQGISLENAKVAWQLLKSENSNLGMVIADIGNDASDDVKNDYRAIESILSTLKKHFDVDREFDSKGNILANCSIENQKDKDWQRLYELEDKEVISKNDMPYILLSSYKNVLLLCHEKKGCAKEDMFWGFYDHSNVITPLLPLDQRRDSLWYPWSYLNEKAQSIFLNFNNA